MALRSKNGPTLMNEVPDLTSFFGMSRVKRAARTSPLSSIMIERCGWHGCQDSRSAAEEDH